MTDATLIAPDNNKEAEMIKTWSYSRLTDFEPCKLKAKLKYIDKIPEPERPLPPGKDEHANDRGTRVHEAAEAFIKGGVELIPELSKFAEEFLDLRDMYAKGKVSLEGEWAYDVNWNPVGWSGNDAWVRMKLDAMVTLGRKKALVIDYKTGKKYGNEVKHAEQGQLYQLATFLRYPKLEEITVEFWYTDHGEVTSSTYTRAQGLRFMKSFHARGLAVTTCTEFPANPNRFSCQWCPYGPKGTGHCTKGV